MSTLRIETSNVLKQISEPEWYDTLNEIAGGVEDFINHRMIRSYWVYGYCIGAPNMMDEEFYPASTQDDINSTNYFTILDKADKFHTMTLVVYNMGRSMSEAFIRIEANADFVPVKVYNCINSESIKINDEQDLGPSILKLLANKSVIAKIKNLINMTF